MKKQYLLTAILALGVQFAQAQFTLEGEFRPRAELKGSGQSSTALEGSDPFIQTTARVALNAKYKTETYTFYTGFQEVFEFGDRQQISPSGNGNFRVQEAWVDLKLSEAWSFKLGRQPLSYDDQRILGGLGWAQQARTHDVGVIKHKKEGFTFDAGYSVNTDGDGVFSNAALFTYDQLGFLHANKKFGKVSLSALLLGTIYQNDQAFGTNKSGLITAGLHAKGKFGKLGLAANIYIQDGDRVGDTPISGAYLTSLDATYKINDKVTVLGGAEIISGAGDEGPGFFPLYGTNHKFNGYMDRFYVGNYANANGLVDLNIGAKFVVGKGASLSIKGHNFSEESNTKNGLGQEVDIVFAKKFKQFKLVAGYSQFFESDDFTAATSKSSQNWAWAMLVIKPKFFTGAKK